MNERDKLIELLIKEKGGSREDYLQLLDSIAYHESAHTMDPSIKQRGGGPGRGVYQFEEGKNAGGITALRRIKQYYDSLSVDTPKWVTPLLENDTVDASTLSRDQQDTMFLANMRQHPNADMGAVFSGKQSVQDFWANYHWAGADKDRATRLKSFNKSFDEFNTKLAEGTLPVWDNPTTDSAVANTYDGGLYKPLGPIVPQPQNKTIQKQPEAIANVAPPKLKLDTPKQQYKAPKPPVEEQGVYEPFTVSPGVNDFKLAMGGSVGSQNYADRVPNTFGEGGTHEANPLGGIPMGNGNSVEQDEVSYNLKSGKFIFSNRINYE